MSNDMQNTVCLTVSVIIMTQTFFIDVNTMYYICRAESTKLKTRKLLEKLWDCGREESWKKRAIEEVYKIH